MDIVIVESPAKATTINKYLGNNFKVYASYGHVRDLPPKNGSVDPENNFKMLWEVSEKSEQHIRKIRDATKGAKNLYLATDPDREGEAISWHVLDELKQRGALKGISIKRIVFTEITKNAVLEAMSNPRNLDNNLIDAYRARRALDYLMGFTLSPVLWRKLPGARSAGRVQSVALRLIAERESNIENFSPKEYWSIDTILQAPDGREFNAKLTHFDGKKLDKFSLKNEEEATSARNLVEGSLTVNSIEPKRIRRNPAPPFTTSTLQQEASRKLRFSAKNTMQTAQQLYEGIEIDGERVGLITYMRTDGVQISNQALQQVRRKIENDFSTKHLPKTPRYYKVKAKNAQEAHEAIRPTNFEINPSSLASQLNNDQLKLYELIWKRTLASQMAAAEIDRMTITIHNNADTIELRASGSTIAFKGFLALYQEGKDETQDDEEISTQLPILKVGDSIKLVSVLSNQHFTEPPPRFSEASLVKELENLGIGRPSTYASIISVLQDRNYVRLENRRFFPEDRGRILITFLENFFSRYVEYDFTAKMETQLDEISAGQIEWNGVLEEFWKTLSQAVENTSNLRVRDVISALDEELSPHLFPVISGSADPRTCPKCDNGKLSLKLGKMGPFIGCSDYPECKFTRPLAGGSSDESREIGLDPNTGQPINLKIGRFGPYIQLGEITEKNKKPKRSSLPQNIFPSDVDLDIAIKILELPRTIGNHPEFSKPITAGIGRYGPYVHCDGKYKSLAKDDDILSIGLNRAVDLLASAKGRASKPLKDLGPHPDDEKSIIVKDGRFGPYVQHGRVNATIPKAFDPESLTIQEAIDILAAKRQKAAKKKTGGKKKSKKSKKL
ncbi:MAG: DNA topoisomerase I [Alphaproteobacteria bacterium]|nr:DNA topoisomerase I [Alphaproteobacteria bacterium]